MQSDGKSVLSLTDPGGKKVSGLKSCLCVFQIYYVPCTRARDTTKPTVDLDSGSDSPARGPSWHQDPAHPGAEVVFVKVDVDQNRETAQAAKIEAMPTFKASAVGRRGRLLTQRSAPSSSNGL